jgi:hypothetical protein
LEQNFPNPFNPSTVIRFSMAKEERVRLVVFDIVGREVAVLEDGVRGVGGHAVVWNAAGMPSGVYFYRVSAGGWAASGKMVLLR